MLLDPVQNKTCMHLLGPAKLDYLCYQKQWRLVAGRCSQCQSLGISQPWLISNTLALRVELVEWFWLVYTSFSKICIFAHMAGGNFSCKQTSQRWLQVPKMTKEVMTGECQTAIPCILENLWRWLAAADVGDWWWHFTTFACLARRTSKILLRRPLHLDGRRHLHCFWILCQYSTRVWTQGSHSFHFICISFMHMSL